MHAKSSNSWKLNFQPFFFSTTVLLWIVVVTKHRDVAAFIDIPPQPQHHPYTTPHLSVVRLTSSSFLFGYGWYNSNVRSRIPRVQEQALFLQRGKRKGSTNKHSDGNNNRNKKKSSNSKTKNAKKQQSPKATNYKHPNHHTPPWQVMSTKNAVKNIEDEKQRRADIRSGEISSSSMTSSAVANNIKGDLKASVRLLTPTDRQLYSWKRFNPEKDVSGLSFVEAYLGKRLPPPLGIPEVAFLGRSNVGKSSLLNRLGKCFSGGGSSSENNNISDIARVGKTPGATASVNLYALRGTAKKKKMLMSFVDLPGFGYAKLSKGVKEAVETTAERYLGKRRELALGILLVDIRRTPSDDDRNILAALYDMKVPLVVVATKVDKLRSKHLLPIALEEVRVGLGLPVGQPLCVSSVSGDGIKELWRIILDGCEEMVEEWREEVENGGLSNNEVLDSDDLEYDQGYEWAHTRGSNVPLDLYDDENGAGSHLSEESRRKIKENEVMQTSASEAMKLRNLKKVAREMQRKGKL